jgi:hypothetical protein
LQCIHSLSWECAYPSLSIMLVHLLLSPRPFNFNSTHSLIIYLRSVCGPTM